MKPLFYSSKSQIKWEHWAPVKNQSMVKMITPIAGAVIRPSVSLSKLSQTEKEKSRGKDEFQLTIQQKQQTLPPQIQLSQNYKEYIHSPVQQQEVQNQNQPPPHTQINIHDNYMAHILSDPGAIRSLEDVRLTQIYSDG